MLAWTTSNAKTVREYEPEFAYSPYFISFVFTHRIICRIPFDISSMKIKKMYTFFCLEINLPLAAVNLSMAKLYLWRKMACFCGGIKSPHTLRLEQIFYFPFSIFYVKASGFTLFIFPWIIPPRNSTRSRIFLRVPVLVLGETSILSQIGIIVFLLRNVDRNDQKLHLFTLIFWIGPKILYYKGWLAARRFTGAYWTRKYHGSDINENHKTRHEPLIASSLIPESYWPEV